MTNATAAFQKLARADVLQFRLSGLILSVLQARGLLTASEAQALIADVLALVPPEAPEYREVLQHLMNEFR